MDYEWDRPIYIDGKDPKKSISSQQALSLIRKLIAGFRALGIQEGDCFCISSFNDIHYPIFFLGITGAGGVFTGTNPAYTPYELAHTLKTAKVKWILTQPDLVDTAVKATEQVGLPKERIVIFNPNGEKAPPGFKQWKDLLQHGEQDWIRFNDLDTSAKTPAARLFSSGTTGLPKAADLTHYNLIAQHTLIYETSPRPWRIRRLLNLPMFHAATAPMAFTSCIRSGALGVVFARFDPEQWFWAHQEYQITDLGVVPPLAIMAINRTYNDRQRGDLTHVVATWSLTQPETYYFILETC